MSIDNIHPGRKRFWFSFSKVTSLRSCWQLFRLGFRAGAGREILHQTLIEVPSRMERDCNAIDSRCDLETMLCPYAVLFKTTGCALKLTQLVPGSGKGQNLTNAAKDALMEIIRSGTDRQSKQRATERCGHIIQWAFGNARIFLSLRWMRVHAPALDGSS
jgi:hypothetical protein